MLTINRNNSNVQDKYRLQYGQYSGQAGDALTGGGGMVEQWSACLSGMQFSTRDQVSHPSLHVLVLLLQIITVINSNDNAYRIMTATSREAVLRRIRQAGGSTGETLRIKSIAAAPSVIFHCLLPHKLW